MENIYKKVFELKQKVGKVSKDSENPFYKSKYMDINKLLEALEPIATELKLLIIQPIEGNKVTSRIIDIETGESVESSVSLIESSDPQKIGSCITYYRRYTLKSLLGIQEEDDDGNKASKKLTEFTPNIKAWNQALEKGASLDELSKYYSISEENREKYIEECLAHNSN